MKANISIYFILLITLTFYYGGSQAQYALTAPKAIYKNADFVNEIISNPSKSLSNKNSKNNSPAISTNYSGDVLVNLNNNQNILKNNYAEVRDYETCNNNNNANCNAVIGFNDYTANEILWAVSKSFEYYEDRFNKAAPDTLTISKVHSTYQNQTNSAYYLGEEGILVFGDGDGVTRNPMSSIDIVAHEITHGLIKFTANLFPAFEAGALNESFADIFAEMIEDYVFGSNNWVIGSDVTINKNGMRNMANPKDAAMQYQQPNTYLGEYWVSVNNTCFTNDLCGIHTNSGVQNYWFYLLAEGGNGTNDHNYNYQITGIGKNKAAQIAYKNLTTYLSPNAKFMDAKDGSIEAATDLFGANSNEVTQVKQAWKAVGVLNDREMDSLALVALYNLTDGANWHTSWNINQPMDNWYGVTLNKNGRVVALNLVDNGLSGIIPIELSYLSNLVELYLHNNQLSGNIPAELSNLFNLKILSLYANNLSGEIPAQLGNLNQLQEFYLQQNNLTGEIPASIGNLTSLLYMSLSSNELTGNIPNELGSLYNLIELYLFDTKLSGSIPATFGNLTNLTKLYLYESYLSGHIPSELGNLNNLEELILFTNQLSGTLPATLSNLTALQYLELYDNNLSGCYSSNLSIFCTQLLSSTNANISYLNYFDNSWEDFCLNGTGSCISNPIKWQIKNVTVDPNAPITSNQIPIEFDLLVDSLNQDVHGDGLQFTLNTGTQYEDISVTDIHPYLTYQEVDTSMIDENTIYINRIDQGSLNRIPKNEPLLRVTTSIVVEDIASDPSTMAFFDISGGTNINDNLVEFDSTPIGITYFNINTGIDANSLLYLTISIYPEKCEEFGSMEIEILNSDSSPFTTKLYDNDGLLAYNYTSNNNLFSLTNIENGKYQVNIQDASNKYINFNTIVYQIAPSIGNDACAENCPDYLQISNQTINGLFTAKERIEIRHNSNNIQNASFYICE